MHFYFHDIYNLIQYYIDVDQMMEGDWYAMWSSAMD